MKLFSKKNRIGLSLSLKSLALKVSVISLALLSPFSLAAVEVKSADVMPANEADKHQGIAIQVNINTATVQALSTLLSGVGASKAQAIVDYRTQMGPFLTVDDLAKVKGIGPALLEKNRNRIQL
jgi:competence protein ComEA